MKVCVCTMYSPAYQALADISVPNMEEYAKRHGYGTHIIHVEDEKWAFKKHEAFKELFDNGYDLIWYKDVDSIITNLTIPITTFIDDSNSFFITMDATELNGGSVIIKNDSNGRRFNNLILGLRSKYQNEQNCYNILEGTDNYEDGIMVLPQQTINSYDHQLYPECDHLVGHPELGDWCPGSLLLHTPALSIKKRVEVLSNAKIVK